MARSISFVSLLVMLSVFYSSILVSSIKARTTPTGVHSREPMEDGILPQTHFAEFLRALYAPQAVKDDMPNDVFPLGAVDEDEQHHHDEDTNESGLPAMMQKRNARYCGTYLADALKMACASSYSSLFGKRSSAGKNQLTWPFISSDKAHQVLSSQNLFHRNTRGVHDECCLKSCTYRELTSYCTRANF